MTIFVVGLTYLVLSIIAFGKLPLTFFQQDEWAIFGNYLYWDKAALSWFERLFIFEQYTHLIPLANLFSYLQFKYFGLNFVPYGIVSILLHSLNAFLVYYLASIITKNRLIGFLAGLFFLTNSISHQAITWVATTSGTAGSVFFSLLAIIFFIKYLILKSRFIYIFLSVSFLLVSALFKETSLFLFLLFPIIWFILRKRKTIREFFIIFLPLFITGFFYVIVRLYFLITGGGNSVQDSLSQPSLIVFIFRALTIPFKFLAQSFIPTGFIIDASAFLVSLGYPQFSQGGVPNPYIVQSVGVDIISYGLAIAIVILCFFAVASFQQNKRELWGKFIVITCIFIALSSLPFIIIPGPAGYFSLVDGRHLYLTNTFTSILLALLLSSVYFWFSKLKLRLILLVVVIGTLVFLHSLKIRSDINYQVGTGIIRTSILNEVTEIYPVLPKRVVFYVESDKAYYGLPDDEKILPFQSGFGQALLVWYNNKGENFPACFFKDQFLYVLLSVGYRECGERGFGYFRKLDALKLAVKENNLSVESIIGLRYNSSTHELSDITNEVKLSLIK